MSSLDTAEFPSLCGKDVASLALATLASRLSPSPLHDVARLPRGRPPNPSFYGRRLFGISTPHLTTPC